MTSLTFALVWVPEPVWNTARGNSPSRSPRRISPTTARIADALTGSSTPSCSFAVAAADFTWARAWTTADGIRSGPIRNSSRLRWVWAPHQWSAGTRTSPIVSRSTRVPDCPGPCAIPRT